MCRAQQARGRPSCRTHLCTPQLSRQAEAEADRQLHLAEKMAARDDQLAAFADQQEQLRHQRAAEAAVREQQHKERAGECLDHMVMHG